MHIKYAKEKMKKQNLKKEENKILKRYQRSKESKSNFKEKGITLIALVVTIIILLILAGVAIASVTGDNGLFTKTKESTTLSKIASAEEEARMIYLDLIMGEELGKSEEASLSNVVSELLQKGYEIEQKPQGEVSGISIDNNNLVLLAGKKETINVIYDGASEGINYYVKIDDKYYEMKVENEEIVISRESQEIEETEDNKLKVEVTSGSDKITIQEEGKNIKVTAGETGGTATITITYGTGEPIICNVTIIKMPTEDAEPTNTEPTFSTDYGRIDVIWLKDNSNTIAPSANEPNLYNGGLTPVTWTQDVSTKNWSEDQAAKSTWYDYSEQNRYWANAKNADNSYFVWIPRYAYRITYYEDEECTNVTGYYDGYGMYDAINATLNYKVDEGIETVDYNGMKYIVHPSFTGVGKEDNGGGFGDSNGISGFWVAKFEMSRENSSDGGTTWTIQGATDNGGGNVTTSANTIRAVSKPYTIKSEISSWRNISIGNIYLNSYNYDRNKESHLMKNSEWGAVAYLTHSKYGRNGKEVTINNNSNCYTGIAGDTVSAPQSSTATNTYETAKGTLASTTGNVYGIYDMSGGAYEYVAAFDKKGSSDYLTEASYGKIIVDTVSKDAEGNYRSNRYITTYNNGTDNYSSRADIIRVSKTGDATKEVRKSSNSYAWNEDNSYVPYSSNPFAKRGGSYNNEYNAGVFCAGYSNGSYNSNINSFRVVLN